MPGRPLLVPPQGSSGDGGSVSPLLYSARMDMQDPQETGIAFGAMITGATVSNEPPDPSSPLGRIRAFTAEHGEDALTPEHFTAAREGRPLLP